MRKLKNITRIVVAGGLLAITVPIATTIACSNSNKNTSLSKAKQDLNQLINWFDADAASQRNHEDLQGILTSEWVELTESDCTQLNQTVMPTLANSSEIHFKLSATKVQGQKVEFLISFQTTNQGNDIHTVEIKFLSKNIYNSSTSDDVDVAEIKFQLGTPTSLDNKTINELDLIVDQSISFVAFGSADIPKLGLSNIDIPQYLNDVQITYKLTEKQRIIWQRSIYTLQIKLQKNSVVDYIALDLRSSDNAKLTDVEVEKSRIEALLRNKRIATNISNAHLTWASQTIINTTHKPFNDNGTPTPGVNIAYQKMSNNDAEGELTVELTLSKVGERSRTMEVILTGFLTYYVAESSNVFVSLGRPYSTSLRTAAHLKSIVDANLSIPKALDNSVLTYLGIQGMNIPPTLGGYDLKYVLYVSSWNLWSPAEFRIRLILTKNSVSQTIDYHFNSSNVLVDEDANTERTRILSLLQNGKIQTNLDLADIFKPSEFALPSNVKPFADPGFQQGFITSTYTKLSNNDSQGEMTIRMSINSSNDGSSATLDIILTGFYYVDQNDINDVNLIKNQLESSVNPVPNKDFPTLHSQVTNVERDLVNNAMTYYGLGATLPSDLRGVKLTYTIEAVKEVPYELCEYDVVIHYVKGNHKAESKIRITATKSIDDPVSFEWYRLRQLIPNKIESNIIDASNKLPSQISFTEDTMPFADSGVQTSGVIVKHIIHYVDDGRGVIGMSAEITSLTTSNTSTHYYLLTGFLDSYSVVWNYSKEVKSHFTSAYAKVNQNASYIDNMLNKKVDYNWFQFKSGVMAGGLPVSQYNCKVEFYLTKKFPMQGNPDHANYDCDIKIIHGDKFFTFTIGVATNYGI